MRFDSLIVFILISIFCSDSFGLSLYAWSPSGHSNTFVIGVRESESPEQAARRYIELALTEPALKSLIQGDLLGHMRIDGLRPLSQSDFKERALIIANRPTDLRSEDERVESFVRIFKNTNTQSYIVPFAADLGLDQKESQELIQLLDQNFSAFVAMGGADVDIRMWNQSLHESSVVNTRRDQFEKSLIEEKVNTIRLDQSPSFRKDRLLGVCRGAQFVARVMGI
jgi:putative glutamine amidotransferase